MGADIEDNKKIEAAKFSYQIKAAADLMLISLSGLRHISARLGIPMDQITVDHIIAEFKPMDDALCVENEKMQQYIASQRRGADSPSS